VKFDGSRNYGPLGGISEALREARQRQEVEASGDTWGFDAVPGTNPRRPVEQGAPEQPLSGLLRDLLPGGNSNRAPTQQERAEFNSLAMAGVGLGVGVAAVLLWRAR
jgi:hypothetical protein